MRSQTCNSRGKVRSLVPASVHSCTSAYMVATRRYVWGQQTTTLRVLSVFRSSDILESGKKKCSRPKLSRSFRHTSLANAFIAPGYCTGSSNTTYSPQAGTNFDVLQHVHRKIAVFHCPVCSHLDAHLQCMTQSSKPEPALTTASACQVQPQVTTA